MKKERTLTQESFDTLLLWFDPDREQAGTRYEKVRLNLIRFFLRRGCANAEELADETINRVAEKVPDIAETYVGDRALYFYGVAQRVFKESLKSRPNPYTMFHSQPLEEVDQNHECLEECLGRLTAESRSLIHEYYQDEKNANVDGRKMLAEQLGMTSHALRMRAHRIRSGLKDCMVRCLERTKSF